LSRRLAELPTIGPIGASMLTMKVDRSACVRIGAGLLGLDRAHAGRITRPPAKMRLGVITRAGDEALRSTLVAGATAVIQQVRRGRGNPTPWLADLVRRKAPKLAAVALANKMARNRLEADGQRRTLRSAACRRPLRSPDQQGSAVLASSRAASRRLRRWPFGQP